MTRTWRAAFTLLAAALLAGCGTPAAQVSDPAPSSSAAPTTTTALPSPEGPEAELAAVQAAFTAPPILKTPADSGPCPDAAADLTADTGTRFVYWQGDLLQSYQGCQWADLNTVTSQTLPEQRYSVHIGLYATLDPVHLQDYAQTPYSLTPCATVASSADGTPTALTRCTSPSFDGSGGVGDVTYGYFAPDASGAGVWQVGVTIGSQYPGDHLRLAIAGLTAVAAVASASY